MAFVIMIMGVILTVSLPFFSNQLTLEREAKTRHTFEQVTHSLATHLLRHKRLPCPASITAIGADFGKEDLSHCGKEGVLPYKTLGMSPSFIKDGFGHYITYVVNSTFAEKERPFQEETTTSDAFSSPMKPQSYCDVQSKVVLKILDEQGYSLNDDPQNSPLFILLSHGKNGGDLLTSGSRRPITVPDPLKTENANDDLIFIDGAKTNTFDDTLFWKDRFSFASIYAGMKCTGGGI
ncbi:MAG: hypothetical protein K2X98_06660 [Alphaproteobacteria bacterium]|nr:hypothetical protein [Alphaproteobacteria bacterium]